MFLAVKTEGGYLADCVYPVVALRDWNIDWPQLRDVFGSFNHLVGATEQPQRHGHTELLGRHFD
jgi:hypothetical protein